MGASGEAVNEDLPDDQKTSLFDFGGISVELTIDLTPQYEVSQFLGKPIGQ